MAGSSFEDVAAFSLGFFTSLVFSSGATFFSPWSQSCAGLRAFLVDEIVRGTVVFRMGSYLWQC